MFKNNKTLQLLSSGRFLWREVQESLGFLVWFLHNLPKVGNPVQPMSSTAGRRRNISSVSGEGVSPPGSPGMPRYGWGIFSSWVAVYIVPVLGINTWTHVGKYLCLNLISKLKLFTFQITKRKKRKPWKGTWMWKWFSCSRSELQAGPLQTWGFIKLYS